MSTIKPILILLLLIIFQSCKKEDDDTTSLPSPITKNEFSFTAVINDNEFKSQNSTTQLTIFKEDNQFVNSLEALDEGKSIKIVFKNSLIPNKYNIEFAYYSLSPYDFWNYDSTDTTGTFTITNYDRINNYLSGKFYFKVKKVGFEKTKLIQGQFKNVRIVHQY